MVNEKEVFVEDTGKYQNKVLTSSVLGLGVESMVIMLLSFVMTSMIADFNISTTVAGSISTITNMGMLVGGIAFGILADKHGKVRMFIYTVIIFSLGTLFTGFAQNAATVCILRFITGIGAGGEYGIIMALIADSFPKSKQGRVNSYTTVGGQIGNILAALSAAIILPFFGWRALFIGSGVISLLLVIYLKTVGEPPGWNESKNSKGKEKVSLNILFSSKERTITTISLMIMCAVQIAGYFGLMNWLPSILQENLGLSASQSSLWSISTIIGMCLGMLVFGRVMDKFGTKISYTVFLIASAGSVFIYVYAKSPIALLIGGTIVGFFVNGMMAGYGALISNFYPANIRATAINTIFNAGRAIGGLSPLMIGFILERFNITYAMGYLSILYVISLITVLNLKMNKSN